MSFTIKTSKACNFFKEADGKQNPYASQKAKKGDGVSQNEAAKHLVDLQNGAGGAERGLKGGLLQTTLTGNDGKGFFNLIANLDSKNNKIDDQDITKLASLDGNSNDVSKADFEKLKTLDKNKQKDSSYEQQVQQIQEIDKKLAKALDEMRKIPPAVLESLGGRNLQELSDNPVKIEKVPEKIIEKTLSF